MPRPKNNRLVHAPPIFTEFKPVGVAMRSLAQIQLSLDEYEALRLADYDGFSHQEAADEMHISRSTFTRLIEQARKKIAGFIMDGKVLTIEGGHVHFRHNIIRCQDCGHMFKTNILDTITHCPECRSDHLLNLAGGFGHGRCCYPIHHNNKKGGHYARRRQNRSAR